MNQKKAKLLNAAVVGLLATSGAMLMSTQAHAATNGECWGVNACKGQGACGGKGHGCAGKNACNGQGWVDLSKADCEAKAKAAKLTLGTVADGQLTAKGTYFWKASK